MPPTSLRRGGPPYSPYRSPCRLLSYRYATFLLPYASLFLTPAPALDSCLLPLLLDSFLRPQLFDSCLLTLLLNSFLLPQLLDSCLLPLLLDSCLLPLDSCVLTLCPLIPAS